MDFEDLDIESAESGVESVNVSIGQPITASVAPGLSEATNISISQPIPGSVASSASQSENVNISQPISGAVAPSESGAAATEYSIGEKFLSALTAAKNPEEHDALVEMFKAELNAKQPTLLNLGMDENGTQITGSALFNSIKSGSFSVNPDITKSFVDTVQYNVETNLGPMSIAGVSSVLTAWQRDNGYYLGPDKFGVDRIFKNGIMVPEDAYKVSILESAFEKAVHDAWEDVKASIEKSQVRGSSGTESKSTQESPLILTNEQKALLDQRVNDPWAEVKRANGLPPNTAVNDLVYTGGKINATPIKAIRREDEGRVVTWDFTNLNIKVFQSGPIRDPFDPNSSTVLTGFSFNAYDAGAGKFSVVKSAEGVYYFTIEDLARLDEEYKWRKILGWGKLALSFASDVILVANEVKAGFNVGKSILNLLPRDPVSVANLAVSETDTITSGQSFWNGTLKNFVPFVGTVNLFNELTDNKPKVTKYE
jgi:hypothetical protein